MGYPKDKKPKKTYTLSTFAKKELRKQELGIKDKPIAEKVGEGLGDNTALLNQGLQNVSFFNRPVNTTTFEPPATQLNVTQQPTQQQETTEQPQNNLLLYGQSGLPNSEVSTLLGSVLTGQTQQNLYDNVSHSLNKIKEGAEMLNLDSGGLNYNNALAGLKFMNGLAGLAFSPVTAVNEVMKQNPVSDWLINKGAMFPFQLADELYSLTQNGYDYAYKKITGREIDRSDPLSSELDEFTRLATQLYVGGKTFHETGKFFKKGMPEVKDVKYTTEDTFANKLNEQPEEVSKPEEVEKKPYEQPAIIIGEQPKVSPEIDLGNKKQTFTKIINEFGKDLQNIEQKLSSGEITKQEFDALEKQYNETESRRKSWEKRLEDLKEEPKPIEIVEENKRPSDDIYSQENIKNPKYPDRTNEVIDPDPVYKTLNKLYEVDDLPTITTEKNIKLSDIKNGVGQQIEDAINNVKNGLESKTEGKPLVVESEGKYYIQDGFHRIAKAIINNEDNIVVDIAYKKPKDIAEAYHKAKLTNDNPELIKKTEDILKADTEPYFETEEGKRLLEQPKTEDAIPETKPIKIVNYRDSFKEKKAPKEEYIDDYGRERKKYSSDAYTEDYMYKNPHTNQKVRWGVELSNGDIVSFDTAIKLTNPEAYDRLASKGLNKAGDKARRELFNLLPEEVKQKIYDDIPYNELIDKSDFNKNGYNTKWNSKFSQWLEDNDHILKGMWTKEGKVYKVIENEILQREFKAESRKQAIEKFKNNPENKDDGTVKEGKIKKVVEIPDIESNKKSSTAEPVEGESKLKKIGDKITYKGEEGEIIKVYPQDELDKKQGYQSYRVRIESGERDVDAKMLEQKTPISKNIKINTPLLNLKNTREKSYYEGVSYHNGKPVVEVAYIFNYGGKLKQDTKYIPYDKFEEKYTPLKNENEFKKVNRALRDAEKIETVKLGGLTEAEELKREQDKSILIEKTIGRKLIKPESKLAPEKTIEDTIEKVKKLNEYESEGHNLVRNRELKQAMLDNPEKAKLTFEKKEISEEVYGITPDEKHPLNHLGTYYYDESTTIKDFVESEINNLRDNIKRKTERINKLGKSKTDLVIKKSYEDEIKTNKKNIEGFKKYLPSDKSTPEPPTLTQKKQARKKQIAEKKEAKVPGQQGETLLEQVERAIKNPKDFETDVIKKEDLGNRTYSGLYPNYHEIEKFGGIDAVNKTKELVKISKEYSTKYKKYGVENKGTIPDEINRIIFKDKNGTYKIPIERLEEFKKKIQKLDEYSKAKQTIKSALSKDSGISFGGLSKLGDIADPKVLKAVYDVAKYHLENGAVKLADFSRRMVKEVGDWVKPHLRSLWDELNKNRTGIGNIVTSGINTIKKIKDLPKEFKGVVNTNEFKEWYKDSKVRDENGNPIQLYSGHSNAGLYGEYNPKKSTAGGFYATENPEVASGYALSKFGSREGYENGLQYRIKGKNGKYNKKLYQYELSENQKKIIDELKNEQNEYGDYDFHLKDMERYIAENSKYDADVRRWGNTGGIYNLRNIYEFNEQMGYNIAYDKQGEEPRFMRQQENDTELIMNRLGIDWNSYDWEKPGIFPVYLNIKNPIDADKPFPADLLKALEDKAKYERYKTEGELHYYGWTNDYPLREWVKDIKDDNEGWSTKIPKNALPIIKSFGYDGIKERGMKATGLSREERSINWIAFDKEQILNKFDYNYLKALKSLKEKINRPNMTFGLDALPEVYTIAKYHTGKFAEWSKKVIKDVGNWIKPHLRNLYNEITKDRTGLDNVVTQGSPLSFKKKTEIIKDNVENPQTEVRDISEILPTAKNKRAILASDIFTKGDKEAGKDVFNYNNFTESAQINDLIREVATENKKAVDEQKRDIRTWAKTQEGADVLRAMGMDENAFLKLGKGDSLLAERIMAGKDIVNIAGKELLDRIKNLPEGNDPKITLANDYLKYVALVKNLKGLVSESGRALNIARKKSNADVQVKLDLADELIKAGFDTTSLPDFASKALDIIEPTYKDKFYYWWYNSMLSNPLTDVANITGNLSHFGFELMRNAISQNPKDSMQMLRDMKQAHIEGMKQVKDIIKNGETADSKFDYTERRYGEAFQPTSKAGKRFKAILPTTRLAFEDAYFRNMFGAIRKNATLKEISKETGDPVGVVENLIKSIAHNPDLASLDKKFEIYQKHLNALERFIDYGVFQTPLGEAGRNLQSGINKLPPAKMIFPFMKIAVNIAKTGIRTTPYGLKDFLTRKDLTRLEKKDIISRAVTGTAFLAGLGYLISQGAIEITGHGINDKDKRELWHKQGYKENHFYMNINGEKYGFSYQNINPINIPLSIIGNLQDDAKYNRKKKEYDDSNTTRIVKSLLGMAETLSDQSFMQGISNLMRYIQDKDIEGLKKNAQNLFTPNILSLPRDIKNMAGDGKTQYETNDPESRFKDKIGMTEGLKPKLNQFGEPIKSTYERFPFMVSKSKPDDKLTEFLANNNIEISFPSKQTKIGDQVLSDSPSAYYEYTKLSGQRFKEELLKQLPELEKLKTKEEKDDAVDKIVKDIRQQVKQEMSGEDPKEKKTKKKHLIIPGRPNPDKESERNSENKQTIKKHLIIPK